MLTKELLSHEKMLGPVTITEGQLKEYKLGTWYFDDMPKKDLAYLEQEIDYQEENSKKIGLTNILPQHYHNNYRLTYWILKYGAVPAVILIGGIAGICFLLFYYSGRIKKRLGRLVSLSCSLYIVLQVIFYVLGNLGRQLGKFGALPFISEGPAGCVTNMILAGFVISAGRCDSVVTEGLYETQNKMALTD